MQAQRTDRERVEELLAENTTDLQYFTWIAEGWVYHQGSSNPWRHESMSGTVPAEGRAQAFVKLITGLGLGATVETTPDLALFDDERDLTITIKGVDGE